jgi:hypothetical protein
MHSVIILSYAEGHYAMCHSAKSHSAQCRYAHSRYAECHSANCRYAECRGARFYSHFPSRGSVEEKTEEFCFVFFTQRVYLETSMSVCTKDKIFFNLGWIS